MGEILFYAGLIGMALVVVSTIVTIIVLSGSRKALRKKMMDEYGQKESY